MLTGDFLRNSARRNPTKIAVAQDSRRLSYAQLDADADRFANGLIERGLSKGSRLAIIAPNVPEYAIAYFGAARAGCVSAHISIRATAREVALMLKKVDAQMLLFDTSCLDTVAAALALASVPHVIALDAGTARGLSATPLSQLLDASSPHPVSVDIAPRDPLAITFTGGTTGAPKAVLVSHRARYASASTAATEFGIDAADVVGVPTPLFHAAGLFVCFAPAILLGATTVLLRTWNTARFIEMVEREQVTATFMVPTQLGDVISHPEFSRGRLASLRNVSYAGAPMSPGLFVRVRTALPDVQFTENYGQSETGPIAVRRTSHPPEKYGTVGVPAANAEIRIVDASGGFAAPGQTGEIVTRGPHVFDEYLGDPEQTAQAFLGREWLHTGDIGRFDADGFLVLVDRINDVIICGGENIYPAEIESTLSAHPAVAECAAFGIPDERKGELPAAHVVLASGAAVTADELVAFCVKQIARHKRPRLIKFVASLPRSPIGKVQRSLVRAQYWQGQPRSI